VSTTRNHDPPAVPGGGGWRTRTPRRGIREPAPSGLPSRAAGTPDPRDRDSRPAPQGAIGHSPDRAADDEDTDAEPGAGHVRRRSPALLGATLLVALGTATGCGPQPPPVAVQRDVTYGVAGGQRLLLDAYLPPAARARGAAVVIVHGGGWAIGDKADWLTEATALARAGLVAFSINYRLGTAGVYPRAADDVRTAVSWVQDHAAQYGIDRSRIGLFGASAGGQLVMLVGTVGLGSAAVGRPPVAAVASWSGPTDLASLAAPNRSPNPLGCGSDRACVAFNWPPGVIAHVGCKVERCPDRYRQASPLDQVTDRAPPMYLVNSKREVVPAAQATAMAARLGAHAVPAVLVLRGGDLHADAYAGSQTGPTVAFLQRTLAPAATPAP